MLFVKKPGHDFERASLGGAHFAGDTSYSDWPLDPIEIVDGVPFAVITTGYMIFGACGPIDDYVRACMTNCDWSDYRFTPKSEKQKQDALAKLIASPKWKRSLTQDEIDYFTAQIQNGLQIKDYDCDCTNQPPKIHFVN